MGPSPPQVVALSGGAELSPAMEGMAVDYLFYYTAFSVPLLLSNCLTIFVRNDGPPTLSFVGMCAGAAANIFLDWLFIFPLQWGDRGGGGGLGAGAGAGLCHPSVPLFCAAGGHSG